MLNPRVWRAMEPVHKSHGREEPQGLGWHPGRREGRGKDQVVSIGTDRRRQGGPGACIDQKELSSKIELILPKMYVLPLGGSPSALGELCGDPSGRTVHLEGTIKMSATGGATVGTGPRRQQR